MQRRGVSTRVLGGVLGAVLLLASCSGSKGSSDAGGTASSTTARPSTTTTTTSRGPQRASYATALDDAISELLGSDNSCVAGRLVDAIGLERLHRSNVEPADIFAPTFLAAIDATDADRADLEQSLAAALVQCRTSTRIMEQALSGSGVEVDISASLPCTTEAVTPLLAKGVMAAWSGSTTAEAKRAMGDAVGLAAASCPEYHTAILVELTLLGDVTPTPAQVACFREQYERLAAEHRPLGSADHSTVVNACLGPPG